MNRSKILFIVAIVLTTIMLIYSIYSSCCEDKLAGYFVVPIYAIGNILIAIVFAYYLNQLNSDVRKKKEIIIYIINKLVEDVTNEKMYDIQSEDTLKHVRITQRSIINRIAILKEYQKEFKYSEDLKYIEDNHVTYWTTISNHINDINHLKNSKTELYNLVSNITNCLEKIEVNLF